MVILFDCGEITFMDLGELSFKKRKKIHIDVEEPESMKIENMVEIID